MRKKPRKKKSYFNFKKANDAQRKAEEEEKKELAQ